MQYPGKSLLFMLNKKAESKMHLYHPYNYIKIKEKILETVKILKVVVYRYRLLQIIFLLSTYTSNTQIYSSV